MGNDSERINQFKEELDKTFKLWPRDVMERIENEEDRNFLSSMMTDRKWSMDTVDKKLSITEEKVRKRRLCEMERLEKSRVDTEISSTSCVLSDCESSSEDESVNETSENSDSKKKVA